MRAVDVVREERALGAAAASRWLRRVLRTHPELTLTRVATGRGGGKVAYCDAESEATLRALCHRIETEVAFGGREGSEGPRRERRERLQGREGREGREGRQGREGREGRQGRRAPCASSARAECAVAWFECTTHDALAMHARLSALEQTVADVRHAARSARLARGLAALGLAASAATLESASARIRTAAP
jgi:hypothetical protein